MEKINSGTIICKAEKKDLTEVRRLAQQIFPVTYKEIISDDQISYMMDLIYSMDALREQMESGQVFLLIFHESQPAGFASYTALGAAEGYKLNKIYLDPRLQGKGLGRILLLDIINRVRAAGATRLRLNMNRLNPAFGFYQRMGFSKIKEECIDIGNGYVMDDYVLEIEW